MAKATSEKKYNTFVKGLITEATALTFPENASLDEDNFDLELNGSRSRRLGVDYENGYVLTATGIPAATLTGTKKSFHHWDFPGGATDVSIGVVRAYNKLWFVNMLAASPSASLLNGGAAITISGLANAELETTVVNGLLVLVSSELTWPIVLTYNKTTDVISQEVFPIQVRDVWGVEDSLEIDDRPTTLSETHEYNLRNQGWSPKIETTTTASGVAPWATSTSYVVGALVLDPFGVSIRICLIAHTSGNYFTDYAAGKWGIFLESESYVAPTRALTLTSGIWNYITQELHQGISSIAQTKLDLDVYPSNTDIWTLGKIGVSTSPSFEKYDPATLKKNSIDNTEAPKGSHILDLYKRGYSRQLLTGLTTLPLDEETGKVSTVTTFAGRVVYSGITSSITTPDAKSPNVAGSIFFSQTIENKNSLGKCFQEADPTSSTISDIVDTDGGVINFPEISKVIKLVSVKDSLIVFAENGIWEIYGDTGGFKATSYQVAKISTTGITNPRSVVLAGDLVFYWAKSGIYTLAQNPQTGRYQVQNVSLSTIQTFYNELPEVTKRYAKGFWNEKENHVHWIYNDGATYSDTVDVNHYNKQLNLDLALQAFYKFSISPLVTNSPMVSDLIYTPSYAIESINEDVYVGSDAVLSNTDQVLVPISTTARRPSTYSLLTFVGTSFTISKYKSTEFVDWKTANGTGVDYSSYLTTGYETFGELMRTKQVPYIFFYLNRTEDGFALSGADLIATNQSSCFVQAQWNWSNSDAQGKWGTPFQAYRYNRRYIPSGVGDTYDTGESTIVTKNKLRGSGKALSLKIYSETGKDCQLLGWSLLVSGDGTP